MESVLRALRRFLDAMSSGAVRLTRSPPSMDPCFEPYRPEVIKKLRLDPLVEDIVEELVNIPVVLEGLARDYDRVFESALLDTECSYLWALEGKGPVERLAALLALPLDVRRQLLEVYAEHLLVEALEEYRWGRIEGKSHEESVGAALGVVRRRLEGRPLTFLSAVGAGPWSRDVRRAVIAGVRVTFQNHPDPLYSDALFEVKVPVAAKRLLAVLYSLLLVADGVGPCDLTYEFPVRGTPYDSLLANPPCPTTPLGEVLVRKLPEVTKSRVEEAKRLAAAILGLDEKEFQFLATAMTHYWLATTEINEADRVSHLVSALDKALRKPGSRSNLSALPCKVALFLGPSEAEVVGRGVRLRNLVQHGSLPPESELKGVNDVLQSVVRRVLVQVARHMFEGTHRRLLDVLEIRCCY